MVRSTFPVLRIFRIFGFDHISERLVLLPIIADLIDSLLAFDEAFRGPKDLPLDAKRSLPTFNPLVLIFKLASFLLASSLLRRVIRSFC